jgi:phytanoyl-CoA hydroxylase
VESRRSHPLKHSESTVTEWASNGYFCVGQFLSGSECLKIIRAAEHLVLNGPDAILRYEGNASKTLPIDQRLSKLYRFHRSEPFRSLGTDPGLISLIRPLIGEDFDLFLSQVVWKVPGALGQPWHQDSSIFPFQPSRPVVAVWIALTDATEDNSCLRVIPGSHTAELAPHGRDRSGPTAGRYVGLVDQDVADYSSLLMLAGDLVIFDSHLVHASGDNLSADTRVALCFHFAAKDTVDRTVETFGGSPYNDWMPAWRAETVQSSDGQDRPT